MRLSNSTMILLRYVTILINMLKGYYLYFGERAATIFSISNFGRIGFTI